MWAGRSWLRDREAAAAAEWLATGEAGSWRLKQMTSWAGFRVGCGPAIEVQEQEGRSLRRVLRFFFFFFFKEEEEEEYYAAARPVEAFNAV
jgi:hypothetical protein